MITITSSEAQTRFSSLLDQAQHEPIRIEKQGKPAAVLLSEFEYEIYEAFKLASLQQDLSAGIRQAEQGLLTSTEESFKFATVNTWEKWFAVLSQFSDNFMATGREQPLMQERDWSAFE